MRKWKTDFVAYSTCLTYDGLHVFSTANSEEHEQLARALGLIKSAIVQVDSQVSLYEKETRLREIAAKMEPKAFGKIKDGRIFRREDVTQGNQRLLYEGTVNWKAASGRLKGVYTSPDTVLMWACDT